MGSPVPTALGSVIPLASHSVLMIAAVACRPHLKSSRQRAYRITLSFLFLLFFWAFLYALLLVGPSFPKLEPALIFRLEALYVVENLLLIAILGA